MWRDSTAAASAWISRGWLTLRNFTNRQVSATRRCRWSPARLHLLVRRRRRHEHRSATREDFAERMRNCSRRARHGYATNCSTRKERTELDLAMLFAAVIRSARRPRAPNAQVFERSRIWVALSAAASTAAAMMVSIEDSRCNRYAPLGGGARRRSATISSTACRGRTDLNARQTKQAVFLGKARREDRSLLQLPLRRKRTSTIDESDDRSTPTLIVASFENAQVFGSRRAAARRHVALVRCRHGTGDVFAGEAHMGDKPVGLPVELDVRRSADRTWQLHVDVDRRLRKTSRGDDARRSPTSTFAVANAKALASGHGNPPGAR